jgi:2'-5' RNA ligase
MLPSYRYFFALFPDSAERDLTVRRGEALLASLRFRGHLLPASKLHATLHFIGSFAQADADLETIALAAGNRIDATPFVLSFDHALSFGSNRRQAPLVLEARSPPVALLAIERELALAMAQAGLAPEARPYRPHVTLMYGPDRIAAPVAIEPVPWSVREFCLVRSVPGADAYDTLHRWPLSARS